MKIKALKVTFLFAMLVSFICAIPANAEERGTCGDNLTWVLDDNGTLTISGEGEMNTGDVWTNAVPWNDFKSSITSVVIEDGITSIGWYAFSDCGSLYEVTIPDSVVTIGGDAFSSSAIGSIRMGNGVKLIQGGAFQYCENLYDVYISDLAAWFNIEFQGNYFSPADYSTPMTYARNLYIGEEIAEDVVIPDTVTAIKEYAFYGWDCLKSVVIPDTVTSISANLFNGCENLESITLGKGITEIPAYAFSRCTSLKKIAIPDEVTKIGEGAFEYCENLEVVNIPEGVTELENSLFMGCDSIKEITIPESVKAIKGGVFTHCDNLEKIVIPDSVESISAMAFSECGKLSDITIGKGVKEIEGNAFYNSYNLENVYISDLEAWLNIDFGYSYDQYGRIDYTSATPMRYAENIYINNEPAENVVVPDTITALDSVEFYNWKCLKSVTIPDSVEAIGEKVFTYCDGLESITLGNGIETIGQSVFLRLSNLKEITIPESVTTIGQNAFSGCVSLRCITMSASVESIADSAFSNVNPLVVYFNGTQEDWDSISIGSYNEGVAGAKILFNADPTVEIVVKEETDTNGITWQLTSFGKLTVSGSVNIPDGDRTYESWTNYKNHITSVVIENGMTKIGASAFYECINMESVSIPESVTAIGRSAFYECKSLKEITIPKTVKTLDEWVFYGCESLQRITIPENITKIPEYSFNSCTGLTDVEILCGNITFEAGAFGGCNSIKNVYITDLKSWCDNWFTGDSANPLSCGADLYVNNEPVTRLTVPDGVSVVRQYTFTGLKAAEVVIPVGVTEIGSGAFMNCKGISEVTIPDGVAYVLWDAFNGCENLVRVSLPASIEMIESNAFNCDKLTDVYYAGTKELFEKISGYYNFPWNTKIHYGTATMPELIVVTKATVEKSESDTIYTFNVTTQRAYANTCVFAVLCNGDDEVVGVENEEFIGTEGSIEINKAQDAVSAKVFVWNNKMQPITFVEEIEL